MKIQLLVPAAGGSGLGRLGYSGFKALAKLGNAPLLVHTLRRFAALNLLEGAIIVTPPGTEALFQATLDAAYPEIHFSLIPGGNERQQSVLHGLRALSPETEIVVIHDAARPFISEKSIRASIDAAALEGAATVAIPSVDTILQGDAENLLQSTPDRAWLWQCQTPQTFRVALIRDAHERAAVSGLGATDDATLLRTMGYPVRLVHGTRNNFKVTTAEDLQLAALLLKEEPK